MSSRGATRAGPLPPLTEGDAIRFWDKVQKFLPDDCWPWKAAAGTFGHGRFKVAGKLYSTHRIAVALSGRELPPGTVVMHICDNPACCNPKHLEIGTQSRNAKDAFKRGRRAGPKAKLTPAEVRSIRTDPRGAAELATAYGVTATCISHIRTGVTWKRVA